MAEGLGTQVIWAWGLGSRDSTKKLLIKGFRVVRLGFQALGFLFSFGCRALASKRPEKTGLKKALSRAGSGTEEPCRARKRPSSR